MTRSRSQINHGAPLAALSIVLILIGLPALHASEPAPADPHAHGGALHEYTLTDYEKFGVRTAVAAPGLVDIGIELPGEVRPNAERMAHLAPQFAGVAREVRKRVGDGVRAGEVLAVIESQNLSRFEIKAAFEGTVLQRHINAGETVHPQSTAFVVADLSSVWIEVSVFQAALSKIAVHQPVVVASGRDGLSAPGTISYIAPIIDPDTRTASARVVLANDAGAWRPGLFVTVTARQPVEARIAVPRRALHQFEGDTVVFAVAGDRFEPRAVRVGRLGWSQAEILSGLAPGDRYADEGSFLIKAELGKGEAEHGH